MNRIQKLTAGLAVATLVVMAGLAAPAGAASPPVNGAGTVSCKIAGRVKFNPPLSDSGTATSEFVTVTASLNGCSGTADGATVSQGKVIGNETLSTNTCAGVEAAPVSTLTSTVTWKTTKHAPKLASTTVVSTSGTATVNASNKLQLDASGTATAGSFSGDAASLTAVVSKSLTSIDKACAKGSLKKLAFDASGSTAALS